MYLCNNYENVYKNVMEFQASKQRGIIRKIAIYVNWAVYYLTESRFWK